MAKAVWNFDEMAEIKNNGEKVARIVKHNDRDGWEYETTVYDYKYNGVTYYETYAHDGYPVLYAREG